MTRKLLNGIIQPPPKDKKRLDKMSRQEMREKRRAKAEAAGIELSDSYGSERDNPALYGTIDGEKNHSDILELTSGARANMRGTGKVAPSELGLGSDRAMMGGDMEIPHPPCPPGFDKAKWNKMSLAEKCKYLGIDMDDWIRQQREIIMQRMNKYATDFHFYSMADNRNKKRWHL